MQILNSFKFFSDDTTSKDSNILGNTQGSLLVLQVSGQATHMTIKAYGKSDYETEQYVELPIFDGSTYGKLDSISSNGIYNIIVDGISHIYLKLTNPNGAVTAYGKIGE